MLAVSAAVFLLGALAPVVAQETRDAVLADAAAHWRLGDGGKGAKYPLDAVGDIQLNVPAEGEGATPGAKVARLKAAYFDAGRDLNLQGCQCTVYLRARDPGGTWGQALFSKRGEQINFNLFAADDVIGFQLGYDTDGTVVFPLAQVDATAWHDLIGRYDGQVIEIICDGKVMASKPWPRGDLTQNDVALLIGAEVQDGSASRPFSGDLEEAALWSRALSDKEISALIRKDMTSSKESNSVTAPPDGKELLPAGTSVPTSPAGSTATEDWVLNYHLMHPGGDSSPADPNAAIYVDGTYHLHYILAHPWQGKESYSFIHVTSPDMLHWTWQPTKLQPSFTGHGMFSGAAFMTKDGKPAVIYHGLGSGKNQISIAKDADLSAWEKPYPIEVKDTKGKKLDIGQGDPDLFVIGDTYYYAAAQFTESGNLPLFKSKDLQNWTLVGDLIRNFPPDVILGEDNSCANFFPLGNKWVLLTISHLLGCRYYIGEWDAKAEQFVPEKHGRMNWRREDEPMGEVWEDFFAPESVLTPDGRRVMWAWLATHSGPAKAIRTKSVQSLPRELSLPADGILRIKPLRELESLRYDPETKESVVIPRGANPPAGTVVWHPLAQLPGEAAEIRITIARDQAARKRFGFRLFGEGKTGGLPIIIRPESGTIRVGNTEAPFAVADLPADEDIELRIFVDKYLVEVFVNGRQALVAYDMDWRGKSVIDGYSSGAPTTVKKLETWKLKPTNQGFREAQKNRVWEPQSDPSPRATKPAAGDSPKAKAELWVPSVFSNGAVLQRDMPVPVWGKASAGAVVTVSFAGQSKSATAAADGSWRITLGPMPASSEGRTLAVQSSDDKNLSIDNVLVGEVWVLAGQSNMNWELFKAALGPETIASADTPLIRYFSQDQNTADKKPPDVKNGKWYSCSPHPEQFFSAVGYHFAQALQPCLGVPIALMQTAVGGTWAHNWVSRETLENIPECAPVLEAYRKDVELLPQKTAQYKRELEEWQKKSSEAMAAGRDAPERSELLYVGPMGPDNALRPSAFYYGRVMPLQPFAIRGVLWYQGEADAFSNNTQWYEALFRGLIQGWRREWGQGDFPFLFVQLPRFGKFDGAAAGSEIWPRMREIQSRVSRTVPNTAMAVTIDTGDRMDIHPPLKKPIGERLALLARHQVYGEKIVSSGPRFQRWEADGARAHVYFDLVADGLVLRPESAGGFEICGEDRRFLPATAVIGGTNQVIVSSQQVSRPLAVRYAWRGYPEVSLFNSAGLPAEPFRTDSFPEAKTTETP